MKKERDQEQTQVRAKDTDTGVENKHKLTHEVISTMEPVTHEAYGGGMYGTDDEESKKSPNEPRASETQSADGPSETAKTELKHNPPPSSGDRDIDITGQSYIG
ncbi:hypothetical protein CTI12_AA572090 [Artemisia annua]|uniref:Uncharacterized protein n=1 Tax=Artemisia annua TaxID=35608 RepID=A0A2U1KRP9_ARTAN|nr:hypothetical protein CTI12_AA572090 [Artemisia annua]